MPTKLPLKLFSVPLQWCHRSKGPIVTLVLATLGLMFCITQARPTIASTRISSAAIANKFEETPVADEPVSYSQQVRPIFQARCFGCHQSAKVGGNYLMTQFEGLLKGGESGSAAVVAGDPDHSYLIEMITPHQGVAEMPLEADPLTATEIELVRKWISEGAVNDSPAEVIYSRENPPQYLRPPVVTSLRISPDGGRLAVAGIHEVLILDSATYQIQNRLIGRSPRIESIQFSPDGLRLAAAGGRPGEFGELQVWDLQTAKLKHSVSVTGDTLFGASWSPDGTKIAFGSTDNTVRAIDAETGKQILFQNVAEDWIRDTVFSVDGSHLISVGRDMTCKLTEVATERFIDNITSITPGVLKGGISSVARHPSRDEILIGTADGIPKLYRVFRETKRVIGDDANMLRRFPAQLGRIHSVSIANDGAKLAAASGIDGNSEISVYSYTFDTNVPDEIKAINAKVASSRSAEENQKLEAFVTDGIVELAKFELPNLSIYTTAFTSDGKSLLASGSDGKLHVLNLAEKKNVASLDVFPLQQAVASLQIVTPVLPEKIESSQIPSATKASDETDPRSLKSLTVYPQSIQLNSPREYAQLIVQATFEDGTQADVTDRCQTTVDSPLVSINKDHLVQWQATKQDAPSDADTSDATIKIQFADQTLQVPVALNAAPSTASDAVRFQRDVNPLLGKLGCNAGTCHGSQAGKRGFKLSLRGYDPLFDIRALTDDLASRRVNIASPDDSLVLLKASGRVAHEGGALMPVDEKYYTIVRQWIADGARLGEPSKVVSIGIEPKLPVLGNVGQLQQMRVVANFDDGSQRDVTREAFVETANQEVATVDRYGNVTGKRRGEAAILARYEGAFAATTLTVMGKRDEFVWQDPPTNNSIDQLVAQKWQRMKILPSELCDDYEFVRRVHLDLTGLPPTAEVVRAFADDSRETSLKRNELIDRLIGSPEFVDHWTNKWSDLLQVNEKFLAGEGAAKFHAWIRDQIDKNVPYDQFVRAIVAASGSNSENPAASYYKVLRTPEEVMENTTHLFLATRFNCNKCHDHPFERWTQDQYYQTAAFFSQIDRQRDPASGDRNIGGTAVENATPLFEIIKDIASGEMIHQRTQQVSAPAFPFDKDIELAGDTRRQKFAQWLTRKDNPYFATSYANRLWGYMMGVGLIEPIDDIRASNPPSNPALLQFLTKELIDSGFDSRHVLRLICQSRVYQLASESNQWNQDDLTNYSHAIPRRLPAEVLFDTLHQVTGSPTHFPGQPAGTRASQLPDAGAKLPSGLLGTLGKPVRESACECERANDLHLGSVLALVSGPDQAMAIADSQNAIVELVQNNSDNSTLINELFLRILNRPATEDEVSVAVAAFHEIELDHRTLLDQLQNRKNEVEPGYLQAEENRKSELQQAQQELVAFIQANDPQLTDREAERMKRIAELEKSIQGFEGDLDGQLLRWRQKHLTDLQWHPLLASEVSQSSGAAIRILPDRSIRSENNGKTVTTVVASSDLSRISAVRFEALSAEDLPGRGPGLADNGNFVVNEMKFEMESPAAPGQWKSIPLTGALADFSQQTFEIPKLFDGDENQQGWAVHPDTGKTHWATFQLETPVSPAPGTRFRFTLIQNYPDNKHQLGRFRFSFSPSIEPVGLSVSEEQLVHLTADPKTWDEATRNQLREILRRGSGQLNQWKVQLAQAQMPVPVSPEIVQRRERIQALSIATPRDAILVRLEQDAQRSAQQLEHLRLTAAQDLTWALINSPSFLFNH